MKRTNLSKRAIVALVCDDRLFVKPTVEGKAFIGDVVEAAPYKGAKPYYVISEDVWDDTQWLCTLIAISAAALPESTPKKKRNSYTHRT